MYGNVKGCQSTNGKSRNVQALNLDRYKQNNVADGGGGGGPNLNTLYLCFSHYFLAKSL